MNPFDVNDENDTSDYIRNTLRNNSIPPQLDINGSSSIMAINLVDDASSILKASIIGDKNLNDEQLKKKGFSIETLLVSCQFNKDKCGPADFKWTHTYEYGNCFTFNDPSINSNSKATSKPAPANGLTLELFLGISGTFFS